MQLRKRIDSRHGVIAISSTGLTQISRKRKDKDVSKKRSGYMLGKTLLGRLGRPEEVARVALFLAADDSSYAKGIDIVVDGGMKVW